MQTKQNIMGIQTQVSDNIIKPVEEVFEAIIDPEKFLTYFLTKASRSIKEGTPVIWPFTKVDGQIPLTIHTVKKNEHIAFEWAASGINTWVDITLEAENANTTVIKITEDGWPLDQEGVARAMEQTQGWTDFLCAMKAFFYGGIRLRAGRTIH